MDKTISRQRKWQLKMRASGRCERCGDPAVTSDYCLKHAVDNRERARKRLHCKRRSKNAMTYLMERKVEQHEQERQRTDSV